MWNAARFSEEEMVAQLREIFPHKDLPTIHFVLQLASTASENCRDDYLFESAVNLLSTSGNDEDDHGQDYPENANVGLHDEAVGGQTNDSHFVSCYNTLEQIFSDCCPDHLKMIIRKYPKDFDAVVDELSLGSYPKKDVDPLDTFEKLRELLPNADPSYLREEAQILAFKPESDLKVFVENAVEKADYPTMQDYFKTQKEEEELNQYTTNFKMKQYLQIIPNPVEYFSNSNRKHALVSNDKNSETVETDREYALKVLCNLYPFHRVKDIKKLYENYTYDSVKTSDRLDRLPKAFRNPRKTIFIEKRSKSICLLQELAYIQYKKKIKEFLKWKDDNYRKARKEAEANGLLQTCQCCFDNSLIPEECYFCKRGCTFCRECVKLGAETVIGNNGLDFPCLADCGSEFSIPTLQMVLDSVVFSRMAQRKQIEEIKKANIEGLETCPFCDFSTIPAEQDKIFKCLNKECLKETCRQCGHIAHVPLKCHEIEYDEDVKMRTYIENKMTEALLRKCHNCNKVFIKESGCNKMSCQCGASMCYVCGTAVSDYSHFGTAPRCPLYTENLNRFHYQAVLRGATKAKEELGISSESAKLKFDPTRDIDAYYQG